MSFLKIRLVLILRTDCWWSPFLFGFRICWVFVDLTKTGYYKMSICIFQGYIGDSRGMRDKLYKEWASFTKLHKFQPLDAVRDYFGVKVALYFAWLGFYTNLLIFPSIVGLLCFIYGLLNIDTHIPSQEICNSNSSTLMCPMCDYFCDFWPLNETCLHSKILSLFDNGSTVFFAVFMSFWGKYYIICRKIRYFFS